MPNYDFKNKVTGEIIEKFLTIFGMEQFLAENPDWEITFLKMQVGDPVVLGVQRPPSDFTNYVLKPIEKRYNHGKQRETRFGRKNQNV